LENGNLSVERYSFPSSPAGIERPGHSFQELPVTVNLLVDDVDALHEEFVAAGVTIDLTLYDSSRGTRQMYVKDADGNSVRFQQES
jgi:uncharacterized glyoxalase superfamily protein PhnB